VNPEINSLLLIVVVVVVVAVAVAVVAEVVLLTFLAALAPVKEARAWRDGEATTPETTAMTILLSSPMTIRMSSPLGSG